MTENRYKLVAKHKDRCATHPNSHKFIVANCQTVITKSCDFIMWSQNKSFLVVPLYTSFMKCY